MKLIKTRKDLEQTILEARSRSCKIGFVPTMGSIHDGHASLAKKALEICDFAVASIFVNPTQFGPQEDFLSYPRTLEQDAEKLKTTGIDVLYVPDTTEVYPIKPTLCFDAPSLTNTLCGKSRPHFFNGVMQVLLRLFNHVKPDVAIFGEKDYQQYLVVKHFCTELELPIQIVPHKIFREDNGLAMSSRNNYLKGEQKNLASLIYKTLYNLKTSDLSSASIQNARNLLESADFKIDYLEILKSSDLSIPTGGNYSNCRIFIACHYHGVRLIDNIEI